MIHHLRYLRTVLRHKWYVWYAGTKMVGGIPWWRLLIHDWSKFTPAEWIPYVNRFEGGRAGNMDHSRDPDEFKKAFQHHWQHNPHHWEHWLWPSGEFDTAPAVMPEDYAREMVADWMGAGRAYTGHWDVQEWYAKNRERIVLHPNTRAFVEDLLYG